MNAPKSHASRDQYVPCWRSVHDASGYGRRFRAMPSDKGPHLGHVRILSRRASPGVVFVEHGHEARTIAKIPNVIISYMSAKKLLHGPRGGRHGPKPGQHRDGWRMV